MDSSGAGGTRTVPSGGFEIVDAHGRTQQIVQRREWTPAGNWEGPKSSYSIECDASGAISKITKPYGDRSDALEVGGWDGGGGRWESATPFIVTQQPVSGERVRLFTATRKGGPRGNNRTFRFDPEYPYEMELTHTTREDVNPQREVVMLRRQVAGAPSARM